MAVSAPWDPTGGPGRVCAEQPEEELPTPEPIVCFAGDNYRFSNPHSRYHMMNALHRAGHPVLWVNSIGMNMPRIRRNGFLRRLWLRLRSWAQWHHSPKPGFHVLTPIALPLFGSPALAAVNAWWIGWQVRIACRRAGLQRPVIFASIPSFAPVIERMERAGLIYYYSDKYDAYRDITARDVISDYDCRLLNAADAVFCASEPIRDSLRPVRANVHYLPHAVDAQHFRIESAAADEEPPALHGIPHPRVGYFGSLTDSNDIELIRQSAVLRPDLNFVLIGRVLGDYSAVRELGNVHLTGFIPYEELPRHARGFDVAFMAWKMTEWIRHSNPIKTREYLCLGLPVVSIRIAEVEQGFGDFVYFFDDVASFLVAIDKALADDSPQLRLARAAAASVDSWDARTAQMMAVLRQAVQSCR